MVDTVIVSTANANMDDYPSWIQSVGGDPDIPYTALQDRRNLGGLVKQGISGPINTLLSFKCVQRAAGANYSVDVTTGDAYIDGDGIVRQGRYYIGTSGVVNVTLFSPPVSGTRIHRIIARVRDKEVAGSNYDWTFEALEDTGGGTPNEPNSAMTIALVAISAGQASVLDANITDKREWSGYPNKTLARNAYGSTGATFATINATLASTTMNTSAVPLFAGWRYLVRWRFYAVATAKQLQLQVRRASLGGTELGRCYTAPTLNTNDCAFEHSFEFVAATTETVAIYGCAANATDNNNVAIKRGPSAGTSEAFMSVVALGPDS